MKWAGDQTPVQLKNRIPEYCIANDTRKEYDEELKDWINNGWLELHPPKGLIPFMTVVSSSKHKVHPVLNYRELNEHMESFTTYMYVPRGCVIGVNKEQGF